MSALMYLGRPITELSRDELIVALEECFRQLEAERRWERESALTYESFLSAACRLKVVTH